MQQTISYQVITDSPGLLETIQLQAHVWGEDAAIPLSQVITSVHNGGVVIGAFGEGTLLGFCYGFPGFKDQEVYLCSHMLAIHPDFRNLGLGRELKLVQRKWALDYGYRKMVWTFDPLETRNGYLNLCKLGGYVKEYLPSYYGEMKDKLNAGLPSDRFLLEWDLNSDRAKSVEEGEIIKSVMWEKYPKLYSWKKVEQFPVPILHEGLTVGEAPGYLIPVPANIQEMKTTDMVTAKAWRFASRSGFEKVFSDGYIVVGLVRRPDEQVNYYVVEKKK